MTQEAQQTISEMLRITAKNTDDFYHQIADHIDYLENAVLILQEKLAQYEELTEQEIDDHK